MLVFMKLVIDAQNPPCANAQSLCHTAAQAVEAFFPKEGVITLVLSDNSTVQSLNKQYRGKDKPTNVLSFPADFTGIAPQAIPSPPPLGDIIIAAETVVDEAQAQGKLTEHHLQHLVIHGILHIYGYDHLTPEEEAEMEGLEIKILSTINIENPYE